MLCLNRKTDYALTALAYIAGSGRVCSAREISATHDLPLPLLMNLLKCLHQQGLLQSARGARGGYRMAADLERVSLHDLIRMLDVRKEEKVGTGGRPISAPVAALQYRLNRFLKDVKVSDLILPGRRIDVPVELVGVESRSRTNVANKELAHAY